MVNKDIVFELRNEFRHEVYNGKDVFYSREYLYDFDFKFHVNNNDVSINNVIIYKNGVEYYDCIVIQNAMNEYEIKDNKWIKFGNNNYTVEIILDGGLIYKNDFYLKVLSGYVQDDVKIIDFATYGIHENYSYLDVMLKVDTKFVVDRVLLYYHIVPLTQINEKSYISPQSIENERYDTKNIKWSFIGNMEMKNYQFQYRHLLFDITMENTPRTLLYKAVIITNNELKKYVTMSTVINPNTMSLNTITYNNLTNNYKNYDIYGGIVGRLDCALSKDNQVLNPEFHDKLFELKIDKRGSRSFLSIIIDDVYVFETENIHIDYMRRVFNKNQSNRDPNWFQIYGEGITTLMIDKERNLYKKDNCRFSMILWCGDDIFTEFNITPFNDSTLAVTTRKTANNIIKYSYNGKTTLFDSVYKDKLVDANAKTGFLTYVKNEDKVYFNTNNEKIKLDVTESTEYIKNCDHIIYNKSNFYYITYDEYGIHIIRSDGINFDKQEYLVSLTQQTLNYIKKRNVVTFDNKDLLLIRFINFDYENILQKIIIERNELTVIDCNEMLVNAYNDLRTDLYSYIDNINYITYEKTKYYINRTGNYEILERKYAPMEYDIFNQKMSVHQLLYSVKVEINVKFKSAVNNEDVNYKSYMIIKCVDDVKFYDDNYVHGNVRFEYTIEDNLLHVKSPMKEKNLALRVAYERVNKRYFFKFSKPKSSVSNTDYGYFNELVLYRTSHAIYHVKVQDIYGNDTTKDSFLYKDVCQTRVIQVEYNIIDLVTFNEGRYVVTGINTELKRQIYQKKYRSDMFFEDYYSYTTDQLKSFENLLSQTYLYDTVPRKMLIFSLSDYDNLYVFGINSKIHRMKQIPSLSGDPTTRNSYMIQYIYDYPLNIKNRNAYLKNITFKVIDKERAEEDLIYINKREKK